MFNKINKFIAKANQVLFFIVMLGVICVIAFNLYKELVPRNYDLPKVQITDLQKGVNSQQIGYKKSYIGYIKDVQVFKISAESIYNPQASQLQGLTSSFSMGYNGDKTVNFMFLPENNDNYMLFKRDRLILNYSLVKTNSDSFTPLEELNNHYDREFFAIKNIYLVIDVDSNLDGYLSEKDTKSLYVSDYDGQNVKTIFKDIQSYKIIKNDLILINKDESANIEYYTYNLLTNEVNKLKTKIDLATGIF
jgi:hypothetical protein